MPHVNIAPVGVTEAPHQTSSSRDTPIGLYPSPATKDQLDDDHLRGRRRMFVGPMPENVAARLRGAATPGDQICNEDLFEDDVGTDDGSSGSSSDSDSADAGGEPTGKVSRRQLLRAYLHKGGRREHFSEREIRKKWRKGGWSRVPLPADASARRWVGASFEVGADIIAEVSASAHPLKDGRSESGADAVRSLRSNSRGEAGPAMPSRTMTMETFVTARSTSREGSEAEESDIDSERKDKLVPSDIQAIPLRKNSKSSIAPSSSGGDVFSQEHGGEPSSRNTSTSHPAPAAAVIPPSTSSNSSKGVHGPHSSPDVPVLRSEDHAGLKPQAASEPHLASMLRPPANGQVLKDGGLRSALRRHLDSHGGNSSMKQRSVIFAESPKPLADESATPFHGLPHSASAPSVTSGRPTASAHSTEIPVPPTEVLNREADPQDTTSAGAAVALQVQESRISDDGVILRDRMLVRAAFNRSPGLPKPFDEAEASRHPDTQEVEWREMLVVWRRPPGKDDRVELYQDYTTPGKERIIGHKDLAFVVPLDEVVTSVSLYSHVDLTFCLTCPPTPVRTGSPSKRARFHRAPIGTNIFVFKVKSRTRALNWIWNLWRHLGGEMPETIDIHCPALGTRVRVDVPDLDRGAAGDSWKHFTRSYLIEACSRSLKGLPDWESMMESPVLRGARLELAWRKESKLEWVWLQTDEEGRDIDWQVLFGLALRQPRLPSQLEIRLGLHTPTHVALTDGSVLDEPMAVEGYLHRIKPKTSSRTNVYITTHDGCLFTLRYAEAEPPAPPMLLQAPLDAVGHRAAREREIWRARSMILDADGYIDLRSILAVRRAVGINPSSGAIDTGTARAGPLPQDAGDDDDHNEQWVDQADESDDEDEGGDELLSGNPDRARLKMKRSFELIMRSGRVVRFEAHSRKNCIEWVTHLRALVKYWTRRHRVDARDEMELLFATQGRSRFTIPKLGKEEAPEAILTDGGSPYLAKFWNWCVLDGCRAIVKGGRLYSKTGTRKEFKHSFHVLSAGHLMLFHITPNVTSYHHHTRTISLADAYVYSGQIAMRSLPRAAGADSRQKTPRRYQDGLESDDSEEDTTFIIWYHPHSTHKPLDPLLQQRSPRTDPAITPLSGKHKLLVCKARSRLERDAWCWALNAEIERLSRAMLAREQNIRKQGILVPER